MSIGDYRYNNFQSPFLGVLLCFSIQPIATPKASFLNFQSPFLGVLLCFGPRQLCIQCPRPPLSISIFRSSSLFHLPCEAELRPYKADFQSPFLGVLLCFKVVKLAQEELSIKLSISIFRSSSLFHSLKRNIGKSGRSLSISIFRSSSLFLDRGVRLVLHAFSFQSPFLGVLLCFF